MRSSAAYLRAHVAGAVSVPASSLSRSLHLLPPRDRDLLVLARDGAAAASAARGLRDRGWTRVGWLDGSPAEVNPGLLRTGRETTRLWEPTALLEGWTVRLPRSGRALDLACGSGRDATYLALRGFDVLGVDLLPDALRQARLLARRSLADMPSGGRTTFRRVDLTDSEAVSRLLRPQWYDVLICFRYLDRQLLPRLPDALAPGGWLIYQTFLEAQARAGRKPRRAAFLLKPGELRRAFTGLEIVHSHEGEDARGDHLASLVARRRGGSGP